MCERRARVRDLALPALVAQLAHRFDQQEDPEHSGMAIAQSAPGRVDGQLRAGADAPVDHRPTLAFGAEPEVLEGEHDEYREPLVDLGDVDVLRAEPGHLERSATGLHPGGRGETWHVRQVTMV